MWSVGDRIGANEKVRLAERLTCCEQHDARLDLVALVRMHHVMLVTQLLNLRAETTSISENNPEPEQTWF